MLLGGKGTSDDRDRAYLLESFPSGTARAGSSLTRRRPHLSRRSGPGRWPLGSRGLAAIERDRMNDAPDSSPASQTSGHSDAEASNGRTEIVIVDDHPAIREALATSIGTKIDMRLVGESGTATKALQLLERRSPDVIVVDISLEDAHGLDLIEEVRKRFPAVRIVVFSMYDESVYAERAIRAGASGYVMKTASTQEVVEAIRTVGKGEVYLSKPIASRILRKVIQDQDYELTSATDRLTDREITVFRMLGEGQSVRDIAETLDLSRKTVETYRRRAKEKLGFETVAELLQYAVQWTYGREQDEWRGEGGVEEAEGNNS